MTNRSKFFSLILVAALTLMIAITVTLSVEEAVDARIGWIKTATLPAPEALQAAAVDEKFAYAIENLVVAKYDRASGKLVGRSSGEAHHLNSGFFHQGKLYCAHSNFPKKPEKSEIKVYDPQTMELTDFHSFGAAPHGSLTVVLHEGDAWWCVFAIYGTGANAETALVKFDDQWRELGVWKFPESVISDLGAMSISGGVWRNGELLATGHDKRVIYRLRLPKEGQLLEHIETVATPFPGQGIAVDPVTGGLVGIDRARKEIVFAKEANHP
ncbi:hypothetical protein LOC68_12200 [Blastopirellula sp. JC732]|uniref:Uncharacterized protein n=1 Tax=Blastopirellula sediminis TaxID=2894196 RepID=A0A9X1MM74_9BACT|nr:hypothetical protein [Blastopirellula sediminis]MCC9607546.1 hypothetical protein [Blastopirellula sediminis]MCC9629161.1 hypothetical protein [Blastopirellula sediminis]